MPAQTDGLDANEVFVAGDQRIFIAPVGTTMPTDVTTTLASEWIDLGYTTEDGVKLSFGREVDEVMSSQSLTTLRTLVKAAPKEIEFAPYQVNADVMALAMGGGSIAGAAGSGKYIFTPAADSFIDEHAMIVEATDTGDIFRFCYRRVSLSDKVEIPLTNTEAASFKMKFQVLAATPTYTVISNVSSWNVN